MKMERNTDMQMVSGAIRAFIKLLPNIMYNGQDGVDKWLHENGYLDEPGFFVDLGSSHPINNNNTYFLERMPSVGVWKGICIDADARVQPLYEQMRPGTIFELAIATDKAGVVTYYLSPMQEASGMNDTLGDGTPVQAEATTLTDILKKHKVKEVDALFVDVEGHEAEALKGFDFKKWKPRIVVIEHTAFGNRSEEAKELLEAKGYTLAHETTFNYIFTK